MSLLLAMGGGLGPGFVARKQGGSAGGGRSHAGPMWVARATAMMGRDAASRRMGVCAEKPDRPKRLIGGILPVSRRMDLCA
jgi:hypothetical protein